jgi:hypothetical protein
MAATTWRPVGGSGRRGARTRRQHGRGAGLGQGGDDTWMRSHQEVARRRRQSGDQGRRTAPAIGEAGENRAEEHVLGEEEEKEGVQGPVCKT